MPQVHAPIALFVFRRPDHTRRTLEALASNPRFADSPLHIFCDGPRGSHDEAAVLETRKAAKAVDHPNPVLHESDLNKGLARSVLEGVSAVLEAHDRIIVLEDDLIVSPGFLDYMNDALEAYADAPAVFQISGHMFPLASPARTASFLPMISTWGWATWRRAWEAFRAAPFRPQGLFAESAQVRQAFDLGGAYPYGRMLKNQMEGRVDSWGIQWYLFIFQRKGITLFPPQSLVRNEGFDGSGTHGGHGLGHGACASGPSEIAFPIRAEVDQDTFNLVRAYLAKEQNPLAKGWRKSKAWASRVASRVAR